LGLDRRAREVPTFGSYLAEKYTGTGQPAQESERSEEAPPSRATRGPRARPPRARSSEPPFCPHVHDPRRARGRGSLRRAAGVPRPLELAHVAHFPPRHVRPAASDDLATFRLPAIRDCVESFSVTISAQLQRPGRRRDDASIE